MSGALANMEMEFALLEVTPLLAVAKMKNVISVHREVFVKQDVSRLCYVVREAFQLLDKASALHAASIHLQLHRGCQHVNVATQQPEIIRWKGLLDANLWSTTLFSLLSSLPFLSLAVCLSFVVLLAKSRQTSPATAKAAIVLLINKVRVVPNL